MSGISVPNEGCCKTNASLRKPGTCCMSASTSQPTPCLPQSESPHVKDKAPNFEGTAVINSQFKDISLRDYQGQYLVLFFYPMDFTFVCPTEILAISDRLSEFKKISASVVGCSTDSHFSHLEWINTPRKEGGLEGLTFPLLADKSMKISKSYGILNEKTGYSFRGTFIIDPQGVIRQITINDDGVGRNVDEILRLIQAFQFTDEHGEVCPANWKHGDKGIVPTVDKAKEYFEQNN